jgi:hypothetical protein
MYWLPVRGKTNRLNIPARKVVPAMKRNEGCGTLDSILSLYAETEDGKLLSPLDGFRGIPCGFELFMNEFGGRVILLCESCAVKNGYLGASAAVPSGIS